jgi:hypothetical protein
MLGLPEVCEEVTEMQRPAGMAFEGRTLQALAVGVWGACVGMFLTALLLTGWIMRSRLDVTFHPAIIPGPGPLAECAKVPWQEVFEKRMFLLQCLCCPPLAWLALALRRRLSGWACLGSFALFVPVASTAYRHAFQGAPRWLDFVAAGLALGIPWLRWPWLREGGRRLTSWLRKAVPGPSDLGGRLPLAVLLLGLLVVLLFPLRPGHLADTLWANIHTSSYCLAPALYYLKPGTVPGLDFESQYGIGHAYVFSFFLGSSFRATVCAQVWFLFLVSSFYYLTAYAVLARFLGSPRAALLATLVLVAAGMECESYGYPSCFPVRHPFLFLFVGCAAREALLGRRWLPAALAGVLAGLSLFWQTDIGLVLGVLGGLYYGVLLVRERGAAIRLPLFAAGAGLTFALLALAAFGPRALSLLFVRRVLEPPLLYASHFGSWRMNWRLGWPCLYNVIAPAVTLASIGWALKRLRSGHPDERGAARYLLLFGVAGLLMLFKWVNRSLDNLWALNAAGVIVVLFWWLRYAALALGGHLERRLEGRLPRAAARRIPALTGLAAFAAMCGLAVLASLFHDRDGQQAGMSSSPLVRLTQFTKETSTPLNRALVALRGRPFRRKYAFPPCSLDSSDVSLLRRLTGATEAVALVSSQDWIYLAEARRAPGLPWLPVYMTHTRRQQERLEEALRAAPGVFLDRSGLDCLRQTNPALYKGVMAIIKGAFVPAASSTNLDFYRRASPAGLSQGRPGAGRGPGE